MKLLKAMKKNENFSNTEQNIITYLLTHPKDVAELSIRELAEKTYTSSAAIFRLCKKLDLKGYREFKIKFISEYNRTEVFASTEKNTITAEEDNLSIVRKIASLQIEAIEESKNELDAAQLKRIIEWVETSEQIDFYAFDDNVNIARAACCWFTYAGKSAIADSASNTQLMRALSVPKTHVAMILSRTGQNKCLIKIAQILKRRGIKSILFTPERGSPLVALCDEFVYVANTDEFLNMGSLIFSTGVQYLLNVIFGILISRNYAQAVKRVDTFESINGRMCDKERLW